MTELLLIAAYLAVVAAMIRGAAYLGRLAARRRPHLEG